MSLDRRNISKALAASLVLAALLTACDRKFPMKGRTEQGEGIYECRKRGKPTYRYDTRDDRSFVLTGRNEGIEFRDRFSGQIIQILDEDGYRCQMIERFD